MRVCAVFLRVGVIVLLPSAAFAIPAARISPNDRGASSTVLSSMLRKLCYLHANAAAARPDPAPTEFTESEINSYLAAGSLHLPAGVRTVRVQGAPGVVTGSARVDFDQLRAGRSFLNPLLSIFSGVHYVLVVADARGTGGKGIVHVDAVSLDGVEIPRFVLQLFVEAFLRPRYPEIGLDSRFELPDRIETATVESHKLTVRQR
jgi:hypothetical protein